MSENNEQGEEQDEACAEICGDTQLLSGTREPCDACGDTGWLIGRACFDPCIERCDACEKYRDDMAAAEAYLSSPGARHWLKEIVLRPKKPSEM